jgi:hypothetical protein
MRQQLPGRQRRPGTSFRALLGVALALGCAAAVHADAGADFSAQDRKQFVEAPERFRKTVLPALKPISGVYWLNDEQLIMSVIELDGWRAETDPPPATPLSPVAELPKGVARAITLNVLTGARANAPYPGRVVCADRGVVVFQLPVKRETRSFRGRYGEGLAEVRPSGGRLSRFNGADCAPATYDEDFETLPLLPEDGALRVALNRSALFWQDEVPLELLGPDGKLRSRFTGRGDAVLGPLRYKPFLDAYAIENLDSARRLYAGAILSREGELSPIQPDPFLHRYAIDDIGYSIPRLTKLGVLWTYRGTPEGWRRQGLYLREKGRLLRLEDQYVTAVAVSPGGCRAFYTRRDGDPNLPNNVFGRPRAFELVLLTLCD